MRTILLQYAHILVWVISLIHLILLALFARFFHGKTKSFATCMFLIGVGLFYDSFVIALGSVLDGQLLQLLSQLRFISHGALVPLLFPICGYVLHLTPKTMRFVWAFTALVIAGGIAQGIATVTELRECAGILRYASSDQTPMWADSIGSFLSFGTIIPVMICGIIVWVKDKTPNIFLSGALMFVFSAIGPATGNMDLLFLISMFGEVLMMLFLLFYCSWYNKNVSTIH